MQIAAEKNCWLSDLDDVPLEELNLWIAYYDLEQERHKKLQKQHESEHRRGR